MFLKEIKMAKVSSGDKVLFIGCGIFPSEPILIAEETNASIVAIDNNKASFKSARSYIQKKGLSDCIKIEYADGIDYPVEDFDVIFVAISVCPIELVLRHLFAHMKTNTRVLCKGIKNDIINVLEKEGMSDVYNIKSVLNNPKTQSFLLIKK